MKTKIISYAPGKLPPLTKARLAKLKALATRRDIEIYTSDIAEMTEERWRNARRGHFYRPRKRQITARVDTDVLDWLKAQAKGYQSRINAILRREMLMSVKAGRQGFSATVDSTKRLLPRSLRPTPDGPCAHS